MPNLKKDSEERSFLLLQGVASPFFNQLETALLEAKQSCLKVNFCAGDVYAGNFFKKAKNHINYRGSQEGLSLFYTHIFNKHKITDIALFGDTRPIHVDAIRIAKQNNINVHVFEEGYFRPDWITLDSGGVNAYSDVYIQSKNKPLWFLNNFSHEIKNSKSTKGRNLSVRAWHDIRFHLASFFLKRQFPYYKTHRPDSPLAEYYGFARRMPMVKYRYTSLADQKIDDLVKSQSPYYLLPLQLQADCQMRMHSPFESLCEVIKKTITSFHQYAPNNSKLVIKLHPLDPWFIDYEAYIKELSNQLNISEDRIIYLEAGNLDKLLSKCQGTVLVNSTVGTSALAIGCPVIALGSAIYDIDGLTFQGTLNNFWKERKAPNSALFHAFKQCYLHNTQINGSFYNNEGIKMAVAGSVQKLLGHSQNSSSIALNELGLKNLTKKAFN